MIVEIVPFERRHLDGFKPGHFDAALVNHPDFNDWALKAKGKGLTAFLDGRAAVFFFMDIPEPGLGRVYVIASDEARKKHWLWFGLAFRRGLAAVPKNLGLRFLEAEVPVGFAKSREWVERMGFEAVSRNEHLITYRRRV